ncbi:Hypothetical predicted protein [Mytilus galloprovincialis]|nr:Hypothetical predicted protein [Mytilus galloprovincialis]
MTAMLGMYFVPAIKMKRNRCHKRPNLVECPLSLPRGCDKWNLTVTTNNTYVGSRGIVKCPAGHSLIGNANISCSEDGVWRPINAICVSNVHEVNEAYVRSFRGSTYILVKDFVLFRQAKESCSSMCGSLIEINNKEENTFIISAIQELGLFFPFIGLEFKNGGSYVWQSGNTTESNMFDNWANKVFPEGGSCVYIDSRPNTYKWRDSSEDSCNYTKHFNYICESSFDLP